jgi:predicted metal-dependent hydrolase
VPVDPLAQHLATALAEIEILWPAQKYWEIHEVLERVWLRCRGPALKHDRAALWGLILLAAALHKARRQHHPRAARQLFARALARLAPLPDAWHGIDLRAMERLTCAALADPALATPLLHAPLD